MLRDTLFEETLRLANGNQRKAAQMLGVSRGTYAKHIEPLSHRHHQLITSLAKTAAGSDNLPINVMYVDVTPLVAVLAKCQAADDLVFASA
ncbi:helix-turn-helix domain-containing protein [Vibrio hyugaensis]|uniref:helix-turn-helix domain-containing protein n=1 Tax=Vibrio hyugaensis TaxID=1534743 RepID=UPI003DA17122